MPTDERILGFSNPWYKPAIASSQNTELAPDLHIWVINAPYFVATKIVAFRGRGKNDYRMSRDLEDVITVIDGRESITDEIKEMEGSVQTYLAEQMRAFLDTPAFLEALPGHVPPDPGSQARVPIILEQIRKIAEDR